MEQELTGLFNAPVVFAHNDLLSGNIMLNEKEGIPGNPLTLGHILLTPAELSSFIVIRGICLQFYMLLLSHFLTLSLPLPPLSLSFLLASNRVSTLTRQAHYSRQGYLIIGW